MLSNQYTIKEVKQIINATGDIVNDCSISNLVTDSRRINNAAQGLFFCFKR